MSDNPQLALAEDFVLNTGKNIFLTGRAGTGKTTFLRHVLKKTSKNYMVVAPTGVAAINAGGITIHSLFHLPLTAFTPDSERTDFNIATNRYGLAKHIRYRKDKAKLIRNLDLLVIDEISMVRADLLDAIDYALRRTRQSQQPFGNVQLLVIGDLFQLAPVVKQNIWHILRSYYASPYFFDAIAWKDSNPITIELTKIYRQKNQEFIEILNRMRKGQTLITDIERLNELYRPDFDAVESGYVSLSTHNRKVDAINEKQMKALDSEEIVYPAIIEGTFNENAYPAEKRLCLKVGAQVMFIRNDPAGNYYNGKIGEVVLALPDEIKVRFEDQSTLFVERMEWPNKKYVLNEETNEIEELLAGNFSQFPLRLAWAITVHKSQGLTFENMAVDLGDTFASGQAYVALSRCTSLKGLVLLSPIHIDSISVSNRIVQFHDHANHSDLHVVLREAKLRFATEILKKAFALSELSVLADAWLNDLKERDLPQKHLAVELVMNIRKDLRVQRKHAQNFQKELSQLVLQYYQDEKLHSLQSRINKGVAYFTDQLHAKLALPVHLHIQDFRYKTRVKKYIELVQDFEDHIWAAINNLYQTSFLGNKLYQGPVKYQRKSVPKAENKEQKSGKTPSYLLTHELYQQGKSVKEIAQIRNLKKATIESHFAKLVEEGKVNIYDLMEKASVDYVVGMMKIHEDVKLTELKRMLSLDLSFSELRTIRAWRKLQMTEQ